MTAYISILRGINVSGHRMIRMDDLKNACIELGFRNVRTYIQSGNLIFESDLTSTAKISDQIRKMILDVFGFEVPVLTLALTEFEDVVNSNPFSGDSTKDSAFFHVTFLAETPEVTKLEKLVEFDPRKESHGVVGRTVYLYCPDGYSKSKFTNSFIESQLNVVATTRNWKSTNDLLRIARTLTR